MADQSLPRNTPAPLSRDEALVLARFDDTLWMRRGQVDPVRVSGEILRKLQARGLVVKRKVADFDAEYALTDAGRVAQREPQP